MSEQLQRKRKVRQFMHNRTISIYQKKDALFRERLCLLTNLTFKETNFQFAQKLRLPCARGAVAVLCQRQMCSRLRGCFVWLLTSLQPLRLVPRHLPLHRGGICFSSLCLFCYMPFCNFTLSSTCGRCDFASALFCPENSLF